MALKISDSAIDRRSLVIRDTISLLAILLITSVLFVCTLFLFHSFSTHRAELAERWSDRGRRALAANKPQEAISDLRTALSYAPGTRSYELLLAQALGHAGRQDESYNYFLGLHETAPGDGDINLALARLAAQKGNRDEAVQDYRAAIYGTWGRGNGVERRAAVRTELARYLIEQQDFQNARMELLIAGGNGSDSYDRDMKFGHLFEAAKDPKNAAIYYQKAIASRPGDASALEAAGRVAYSLAEYVTAHRLLDRAADIRGQHHSTEAATDADLAHNAARLVELNPAPSLPPRQRIARIIAIRSIAKKRLDACERNGGAQSSSPKLQSLNARWAGPEATSNSTTLLRDPARQDEALQLAFDTERMMLSNCGAATGDDALLLRLAEPPKETRSTNE